MRRCLGAVLNCVTSAAKNLSGGGDMSVVGRPLLPRISAHDACFLRACGSADADRGFSKRKRPDGHHAYRSRGQGGGTRTHDLLLPRQVRYQTALHPVLHTAERYCTGRPAPTLRQNAPGFSRGDGMTNTQGWRTPAMIPGCGGITHGRFRHSPHPMSEKGDRGATMTMGVVWISRELPIDERERVRAAAGPA